LMIFVAIGLSRATVGLYEKNSLASIKRQQSEEKLNKLLESKENLEGEVANLGTEGGIEKELREKLNFVKPGEKVIVIVDEENKTDDSLNQPKELEKAPFWSRILNIFRFQRD